MVATIVLIAATVFITTTVVLLFTFYFTDRRRMTTFTTGQVIRADERVSIERNLRRTRTEIVARYTAWGKDFEVKGTIEGSKSKYFPPGHPIPIRYNPGEPDMSELVV